MMLGVEEVGHLLGEGLHAHRAEGSGDRAQQHRHIAVVTVVVLGDRVAEPLAVFFVGGPEGLLRTQRDVLLGHLGEPLQDPDELNRYRFLTPQRAIGVEGGDPLGARDEVGPLRIGHLGDELQDHPARWGVIPQRET